MATYKVKQGDNLTTLAKKYGTTVNDLAKANNIANVNRINTGATLTIPGTTSKPTVKPTTTKQTTKPTVKPKTVNPVPTLASIETSKPTYAQSDAVTNAANMLTQYEKNKPGAYTSGYSDQINSLLNQIQNREKFNYDMNADPMYQQYKDQYTKAGQMAMMDTMGNASALTGGYGSSYASTAGNQAYQANLAQMNNVIPELYNAAYGKYQNEGNDLYNQANLLQSQDQSAYGKYRDGVSDYNNDLNYYYSKYNDMSAEDYNKYLNNQDAWEADRSYYYGKQQDSLSQKNYLKELAMQKAQNSQSQSNWEKEYALNAANVNSTIANRGSRGSSGGSSKKSSGSTKKTSTLKGATLKGSTKQKANSSAKNYNAYLDNTRKKVENTNLASGVSYLDSLYDSGKISESQYKTLYKQAQSYSSAALKRNGSLIVN